MNRNVLRRAIEWMVIIAILTWLTVTIYSEHQVVLEQLGSLKWQWVLGAMCILSAVLLWEAWVWQVLFAQAGFKISLSEAFQSLYVSLLGRYIPGRIWQVTGTIYLLTTMGVPVENATALAIISQSLTLVSGVIVAIPAMLSWLEHAQQGSLLSIVGVLIAGLGIVLIGFFPAVWIRLINWGLKKIGRESKVDIRIPSLWKFALAYWIAWVGLGVGAFLVLLSTESLSIDYLPYMTSAFVFAYIAGYLVIFVPGGIGVREGALVFALALVLPVSVSVFIALLTRFWMTAVEVLFALIALTLRGREHLAVPTNKR